MKDGSLERFAPEQDAGRLIEAEHIARYRLAALVARGRRVLDAGCGTAYGARMLAEAGAGEVVGIDLAQPMLEAVGATMPPAVRLDVGDIRELPYGEDMFGLVVCFQVIEHLEDPSRALHELVRVLAPGGLLLISSSNPEVCPAGDPHHRHGFRANDLEAELSARLANVRLVRQDDYLVSALLSDEVLRHPSRAPLGDVQIHKLTAPDPGGEKYTLAMASDDDLPELRQLAVMTGTLDLEECVEESHELGELLIEAERRLAGMPDLELRIADLEGELEQARRATESARAEATALDERLTQSQRMLTELINSPSWRLTEPLRATRRLLRLRRG